MPVAIKLSKKFYDRFGDDIVTEFVQLLNQVDATYKSELEEIVGSQSSRFESLERGFSGVRVELAEVRAELTELRAEMKLTATKAELKDLERRVEVGFADMRTAVEKGLKEQTRFFFLAGGALLASSIALWFR